MTDFGFPTDDDLDWIDNSWPKVNDGSCCYDPVSMEYGPNYPCPLDEARLAARLDKSA